jgi:hypothetical protein
MASTILPTTFNIKITEEHIVRNSVIKHEVTHVIDNITNIDHRIVTCPQTTSLDLFNFNGPVPGAGTFPSGSIQYVRVTNLDNTNSIALTISGSEGELTQEITPTNTLFMASSQITSSNFNGTFGDNIEKVIVYAMGGDIDVEYTIINS